MLPKKAFKFFDVSKFKFVISTVDNSYHVNIHKIHFDETSVVLQQLVFTIKIFKYNYSVVFWRYFDLHHFQDSITSFQVNKKDDCDIKLFLVFACISRCCNEAESIMKERKIPA